MTVAIISPETIPVEPEPPEVPVPVPGGPPHIPSRVYELHHADDALDAEPIAVFDRVGTRERRRSEAGPLVVAASMVREIDAVAEHLYDGGEPRNWEDSDLEVWVKREGVVVWQGPIVATDEDMQAAEVTVRCLTREGYVSRLINGMRPIANAFTPGNFTADLSGWTENGDTGRDVSTGFTYRDPRCLVLSGTPGSFERAVMYRPDISQGNEFFWTIPVLIQGSGGWPTMREDGEQIVAIITHFYGGVQRGKYPITLTPEEADRARDGYVRVGTRTPQLANGVNHYYVDLLAGLTPGTLGRVGEVTAARNDNVSSRSGWDVATFAAATADEIVTDLNDRWPGLWSRYITEAGVTFSANKVEPKIDHGDFVSFFRDLDPFGSWEVPVGTHVIRWGRPPTHHSTLGLNPSNLSGLRVITDATRAATVCVAYADGQDGPTREEGRAERAGTGAPLHAVIEQQPGADVRDLERDAEAYLDSPEAQAIVSVEGELTSGFTLAKLPGHLQHIVKPGDTLPLTGTVGERTLDYTLRVEAVAVNDLDDSVSFELVVLP